MKITEWIGLLGVFSGILAFTAGLLQYMRAQKWKRAEFIAKEFKEFKSFPAVSNAMLMLDWNSRDFIIHKPNDYGLDNQTNTGVNSKENDTEINDIVLANALVHHNQKHLSFSPERRITGFTTKEAFVRDTFDAFFEGLQIFEQFIQSGLISAAEFKPYLIYWIEIIANDNNISKPEWCRKNIWHYIDAYDYKSVQRLCFRYGYDISPRA
jgi:hypothetical protein